MNNYFSDFISKFSGEALALASYGEPPSTKNSPPRIGFVTLYNPSWACENDESFEGLSKQIVFFATPQTLELLRSGNQVPEDKNPAREHLNVVGLLRGTCSLMSDFGSKTGPITIDLADGAIVVMEIESGYSLAIYLMTHTEDKQKTNICMRQLSKAAQKSHKLFELVNLPLNALVQVYGKNQSSRLLQRHWGSFLTNFNLALAPLFGPSTIVWPNRLNHRGFFEFLPGNCYKTSSRKFSTCVTKDIDSLVSCNEIRPAGYFVANLDSVPTKHSGMLHMNLGDANTLDADSVITIYKLMEDLNANSSLTSEFFSQIKISDDIYTLMANEGHHSLANTDNHVATFQDDESENEILLTHTYRDDAVNAFAMLHPARLTESLVVLPLTGTVNGFKSLGLAVTAQIHEAPSWISRLNYFGNDHSDFPSNSDGIKDDDDVGDVSSDIPKLEGYLLGLTGDQILRFLVHVPTKSQNSSTEILEYLLVAYKQDDLLIVLFYESGLEALDDKHFYSELEKSVLKPLLEKFSLDLSATSDSLENSTHTLPDPIVPVLHEDGREEDQVSSDIDNQFFYVIFNPESKTYETSLPDFFEVQSTTQLGDKQKSSLSRVMFHLHNHLVLHFIVETKERLFHQNGISYEQLHKFSSSKHNDWLFYSMRSKGKVIIIIRDSNHRAKPVPVPTPENNYLMQVADSVYGAANLGFLENLGVDVRVWLGGLGQGHEEEDIRS